MMDGTVEGGERESREGGSLGLESTLQRTVFFLLVLVLPLVSFPLGSELGPSWQSGELRGRVAFLLDPDVSVLFAPFIALAWASVLAAIVAERFMARWLLTRAAVYSGVLLTAHYLVVSSVVLVGVPLAVGAAAGGGWVVLRALDRRFGQRVFLWLGAAVAALWVPFALLQFMTGDTAGVVVVPVATLAFALLFGGPGICFLIALHRSLRLWSVKPQAKATDRVLLAGASAVWVAGYGVAWRAAVSKTVELYEALPENQPTCYIATAAANGHPAVVGSAIVQTEDGARFAVTEQLQTLKLAELVLATRAPLVHRRLRAWYDAAGPRLAGTVSGPLRADLVYVAIKPLELVGRFLNRCYVIDAELHRDRMYQSETVTPPA